MLDVTLTAPEAWTYVSEGGSTIVFSYSGPFRAGFTGTVLRLRKAHCDSRPPATRERCDTLESLERSPQEYSDERIFNPVSPQNPYEKESEEPEDPVIEFQNKVTSKLIAPEHLPYLEAGRVEKPWLENLAALRDSDRPTDRRNADKIDVNRRKAVLATDLVSSEGCTVEIKPKWGFLPNPWYLSPETRSKKSRHCRFCMHAYYKSLQGETTAHEYCPLDLFSGDEARVAQAVRGLWRAWIRSRGTINNLKVFVRGKKIDCGDEASMCLLAQQIYGKRTSATVREDELMEMFTASLLPSLLKTPLLRTLSHLQRTLDPLDIEGLSALWRADGRNLAASDSRFLEPTIEDWQAFAMKYLDVGYQRSLHHEKADVRNMRYYTLAYLLSAAFKDCSIILRLGESDGRANTVNVIDLDVKKMEMLRKWEKLDRDIASAFGDVKGRVCVDQWSTHLIQGNIGVDGAHLPSGK